MYPITTMGWVGATGPVSPTVPAAAPASSATSALGSPYTWGAVALGVGVGWFLWGRKRR